VPAADLFYRYPRLLLLVLALIGIAGLSSYALLPRAEDPTLTRRAAKVVTWFPGASPERVEALVSQKLEDELQEVEELRLIRSESRSGVSIVLLELKDAVTDVEAVWTRVRNHLDDAAPELPPGADEPEFEELVIEAWTLVGGLTWEGDRDAVDRPTLRRLGEGLQDRLRAVPGTEEADLWGAPPEEVTVEVDPRDLAALGRTPADLAREVAGADAKVPAGALRGRQSELLLEVSGELDAVVRVEAIPVRLGADGRVVRLGEVARVTHGAADPPSELAFVGGRPAVAVAGRMGLGSRVDRWSADARAVVRDYAATLPRDVGLEVVFDQSAYTEARLDGLLLNLLLGVALVVAVLLVVMGWRSALLVGLSLPLTSLMVLAGMRALEIPMHQMSVTGLIIALGLLIDNAIVVVDEVAHRRGEGRPTGEAIAASVRHLAVPLGSSTLTTVLAFAPIVLLPGPAGEFVGAIAVTVILALVSSLFLALTVIPAVGGYLGLGAASPADPWWRAGVSSPALTAGYARALGWLLRRPLLGVALAAAPPAAGLLAGAALEEQFFPPSDRDQLRVDLRLPTQASLAETTRLTARARELLRDHPAVEEVHWFVGRSAPKFYYNMLANTDGASFYAQALVQLRSSEDYFATIRELQAVLDAELPAAQAIALQLEQGPPFDAPIELHLQGPDLERLDALGEEARRVLAGVPDVVHTRGSLRHGQPRLALRLDEEAARLAALTNADVAGQLRDALDGAAGGSLLEAEEEIPVRVRLVDRDRAELDRLASVDLLAGPGPGSGGADRTRVPLTALGDLELVPELAVITRRHGRRTNTVQGFIAAGVLPSQVLAEARAALDAAGFALPPGYTLSVGGEAAQRDRAVGDLLASAGLLLVLMAASLVLAFDSFRQAGLIAAVGGLAVGLAMAALWVFGHPFGFMAIVGAMGLVGVAINDAIVVLAAIRADPAAAAGDPAATVAVVVRSTRHVVATTLTTVAGFVPLLLGGGAFWSPLATAIAGGVAGATLLALTFVPAAFLLLHRLGMRCPVRAARAEPAAAAAAP